MSIRKLLYTLFTPLLVLLATNAVVAQGLDTLSLTRADVIAQHRLNRGLVQLDNNFVPKGQWIAGATLSFSTHSNDNYALTIVDGINSKGYNVTVSPIVAYAIKDNMALGGRFEYGRSLFQLDSATLSFGDDGGIELVAVDYYALQHSYTAMAIYRQYIPLGDSKRFALFAETRLEVGGSQSKFAYDQPVTGTFSRGLNLGLGVVPGVVAFATNYVAFEVTVGMMGIGYSHTKQVHNQVTFGESSSSSMSFKLNLLSIGLGFAFYL